MKYVTKPYCIFCYDEYYYYFTKSIKKKPNNYVNIFIFADFFIYTYTKSK